jgi:Flp pilus assembly protein TadG
MGRHTIPKAQRGAALVEMALAAPIIIVVLFAVLEFGWLMYSKGVITNASREGARLGVVLSTPRHTEAEIATRVQEYLEKSGFTDPVAINVTGAGGASGTPLAVHVAYDYQFYLLPNFLQDLTGSVGLTAQTVMRLE